jgi:hypothetical protein
MAVTVGRTREGIPMGKTRWFIGVVILLMVGGALVSGLWAQAKPDIDPGADAVETLEPLLQPPEDHR